MKSQFKYGAYITATITVMFSFLLAGALSIYLFIVDIPIALYLILNSFFILVWIWLVVGEWRTKIISLETGFDHFVVRRYFGLGKLNTYYFTDVEGYKISILPAKGAEYEYLYLVSGGKKVAKLSQFYHKNYLELKDNIVSLKIKYLGYEPYKSGREIKEIFVKL